MNEADTCRKFVVPKLQAVGWEHDPHSIAEQRTITDGRIVPVGNGFISWQDRIADVQNKVDALKHLQAEIAAELDTLLPAVLDKAFKGEL